METNYRITTGLLGLAMAGAIIYLVRKDRLHASYSAWWLLTGLAVGLLGLFPGLGDAVGRFLGVAYPPSLVLTLGLCLVLMKILTMDLDRSDQERRIRILTQRLAALEAEKADSSPDNDEADRPGPKSGLN